MKVNMIRCISNSDAIFKHYVAWMAIGYRKKKVNKLKEFSLFQRDVL